MRENMEAEGSLPALYDIVTGESLGLLSFSTWVAQLPFIGDRLAAAVKGVEEEMKEWLREKLATWWAGVQTKLEAEIDEAAAGITGGTEVEPDLSIPGLTSDSMTLPSHTATAKDFEEEGAEHEGEPVHAGAALSGLAQWIAGEATEAILTDFKGWTGSEEDMAEIREAVDTWFAHPEDCRPLWQDGFLAMIQADPALMATLKSRLR